MKRRYQVAILFILVAALAVWLEPTRVVCGWLRGEAFFGGRPTSYWRVKCDEWLERFDDHVSLTQFTWLLPFEVPADPGIRMFGIPDDLPMPGGYMRDPRNSWLKRFIERFRPEEALQREEAYRYAPRILWATPDTEPVLLALQREEKYRWLATLALRRVAEYRKVEAELNQQPAAGP